MVHLESRMSDRWRALVAAVVGLGAAVVLAPAPASAHDELTATTPADGATVNGQVSEVTLTFGGPIRADGSTVTVTGAGGQNHSVGGVSVLNTVVHQPVGLLTSGTYRVDWHVIAGDGDPMNGQFSFTLDLPPEPTTAEPTTTSQATQQATGTPAAADQGSGGEVWWPLLTVVLLLVAATVVLWRRRRTR
jgi:methionine-rich copper-binding protein CopC